MDDTRRATWTLLTVALGVIMVGIDATVVAIANPYIAISLHASLSDLQWITNSYLLVLAVLLIVGGRLGDRFGRKRVFLVGVVGFALASVGVALIGSIPGVIVMRGVQGAFGAMLIPNTLALLRVAYPADKLNRAIGIWSAASAFGVAGAPIIGGLLVERISWQSVFYLNVPVAAAAFLVGLAVLPESRDSRSQPMDFPGVTMLSTGLLILIFGVVKAQTWGWGQSSVLALVIGGLALLGLFVVLELRTAAPLIPPRLFRERSVGLGTTTVVLSFFALFAVLFFVSLYLQNVQGASPITAATKTLPLTLAFAAVSLAAPRLTSWLGPGPTIAVGLLFVGLALLGMTRLEPASPFTTLWPSLMVDDAGLAGGLQATAAQFGGVLGASVLGSIVATRALSVLPAKLAANGINPSLVHRLEEDGARVTQGLPAGTKIDPAKLQTAITSASHAAFMSGFHVALSVGGIVATLGAVAGVFIRRGSGADTTPPIHY
jgi:EmrB/QacA subfamily drug resistance transporter